jgi:predicted N-acetyltransferase YhbS
MRETFHNADFESLARLWNEYLPERYRIDAPLLKQNTVDCPVFDWGASLVEVEGGEVVAFAAVKKSPNPKLYRGPDPDRAHLCAVAYREPKEGIELLADVKAVLRQRGAGSLAFGQDSRHFWPGCPTDCGALHDFLMVEGFAESGEQVDLERDLSDYQPPCPLPEDEGCSALRPDEMSALHAFLESEFPGRWCHDVMEKVEVEGSDCVTVLRDGGRIFGFALTQDWSHRMPISGAVWRHDLGDQWGSLGPIGVAKDVRGKGSGHALLAKALHRLQRKGARRCIIDWTTLVDFYGRHGFEVARRYRSMLLRLDPPLQH